MKPFDKDYLVTFLVPDEDARHPAFHRVCLTVVAASERRAREKALRFAGRHVLPAPYDVSCMGRYRRGSVSIDAETLALRWEGAHERPSEEAAENRRDNHPGDPAGHDAAEVA